MPRWLEIGTLYFGKYAGIINKKLVIKNKCCYVVRQGFAEALLLLKLFNVPVLLSLTCWAVCHGWRCPTCLKI